MKKILYSIVLGTIITYLVVYAVSYAKNEAFCDKFVRIHIIANSDSPYDQAVKYQLRDFIFNKFGKDFSGFKTKSESMNYLKENIRKIEEEANIFLEKINYEYPAKAELKFESFPDKDYGNFFLPAGNYDALKIIIGGGKGRNFFCVMFPPLCVSQGVAISVDNTVTKNDKKVLNGEIKYKFKVFEIAKNILN